MMITAIFPGCYVQGCGALEVLGDELARLGERAFVLSEPSSDGDPGLSARRACAEGSKIHNEPQPVSPELVVAAIRCMDYEGRRWSSQRREDDAPDRNRPAHPLLL